MATRILVRPSAAFQSLSRQAENCKAAKASDMSGSGTILTAAAKEGPSSSDASSSTMHYR